jgi:hypothetical protein
MLTVACVFVRGEYPYTLDYVVRLERMVRRHLARPFRFVCLTDRADVVREAGIEALPITPMVVPHAFWHKVRLFDPSIGLTGRVLYLDLDSLIVAPLDPIVDAPGQFTCAADLFGAGDGPPVRGLHRGRRVVAKHQGSVIVWDAGAADDLWLDWTPDVAEAYVGCDDWISDREPYAPVMPLAWFPRISQVHPPWPDEAKVVLVKKPKNHIAAQTWPWFEPLWGAA